MSLALDHAETCVDLGQPHRVPLHLGRQLGPPQPQHAAQLTGVDLLVDQRLHLLQREAEILEGDHPVEQPQLGGRVVAVTAVRVDVGGPQQADGVVVAQHAHRHPAQAGEVSDSEHASSTFRPDTV